MQDRNLVELIKKEAISISLRLDYMINKKENQIIYIDLYFYFINFFLFKKKTYYF